MYTGLGFVCFSKYTSREILSLPLIPIVPSLFACFSISFSLLKIHSKQLGAFSLLLLFLHLLVVRLFDKYVLLFWQGRFIRKVGAPSFSLFFLYLYGNSSGGFYLCSTLLSLVLGFRYFFFLFWHLNLVALLASLCDWLVWFRGVLTLPLEGTRRSSNQAFSLISCPSAFLCFAIC